MEAWNHNYGVVNGVRLHYVQAGSGSELVILLHGWPEFWYSWRHQIRILAEKYTVIAPDLRGFNESDKPRGTRNYTQETVARDIVELIALAGFSKAVIVGHDWGGAIAWHLALNYPEKVSKLVVMNCPHPAIFIRHLKSNPRQLLRSWYMFFFQLPYVPEFFMGLDRKQFFENAFRGWAYNKSNFNDEVIGAYVKAFGRKGALTGGINYYRANIRAVRGGAGEGHRKVQAPTLLIWGEGDRALGKELTVGTEAFIEGPYKARFIKDCSHWVQNDCPDEVNGYLLEFLSEN